MSNFLKPPCDPAQIQAAACAHSTNAGTWILAVTILGSSMAFIDGTVVNVALPVLQSDFHAGLSQVQWVIEAYALFLTALVLVGGSLGDQYGRRVTFGLGVVIFCVASGWCGLSPSIHSLIVARAVQGVGAALLVPGSLSLLSAAYPEAERGRAIGTWSGFSGLTAAVGPVLGGWFVQKLSWRWAFFINIPFGIAVLLLLFLHATKLAENRTQRHLDWLGAAIATLSLGGLVYGLLEASSSGPAQPMATTAAIAGAVGMALFIFIESKGKAPMMPLDVFHSRNFTGANLLTFLLYGALSGALFFVPFNLIQVQRYSPLQAGSALLPFVFIMFLLSRWAGGLVTRWGSRLPLSVGPVIAGVGLALFAAPNIGGSYWKSFFPPVLILGLGMSISVAPLTTTVMDSVAPNRSGAAAGINNAVARLAGLLAIAALGLAMQSTFDSDLNRRMTAQQVPASLQDSARQQRSKLAAMEIPVSVDNHWREQVQLSIDEAFVAGFRRVVLICAALAFSSGLAAALLIAHNRKRASTPPALAPPDA